LAGFLISSDHKLAEKQKFSLTDFSLIMATVIWGSDYPFAKIAMEEISPLSFSAARTLLATAALFPFFLMQESSWKVSRRDFLYLILLACFGTFLNRICWSVGLNLSTASNAALLMTTSPIFVLITSVLLFRSSVTWRATAGIAVAFVGVFLVIRGDLKGWDWRSTNFLGDLFLLGAAVFWALFTALAKYLLKDYSSLKVTAYVMAIGSFFFLPFLPNEKPGGWSEISALAWFSVFYVGLSGNCLAYFLWMKGIQDIGPLRTILYSYLMPITAIAFSVPLLGETVTATQVWGGLIVFAGIFVARSG
jgi:drug/metabolite transporter (DMT)-like permease